LAPDAAARSTAKPAAVRLAVPALLLLEVAVQGKRWFGSLLLTA
jgi:hypothetical protein